MQNGNKRDREDSQEKEGLQCDYGACATAKEYIVYSFNFVFYSNVKINEAIIFLFFFFLLILECTQAKGALVNNV